MRFSKSLYFEVYSSLICLILPFFSLVMFGLACVWCLLIAAFLHFPCTCISRTCGALLESPMPSRWSVRVADSKLTSRILHLSRVDANSLVLINLLYRGCAVQHKLLGRCFHTRQDSQPPNNPCFSRKLLSGYLCRYYHLYTIMHYLVLSSLGLSLSI